LTLTFAVATGGVSCGTGDSDLLPAQLQIPTEREFRVAFTQVAGVRELSSGAVLVSDSRERTVTLLLPASDSVETIGREGEGPSEYRSPSGLYALRADTTALYDSRMRRVLLLDGSRILDRVSVLGADAMPPTANLVGADTLGVGRWLTEIVYSAGRIPLRDNSERLIDSLLIVLATRGTHVADTISTIGGGETILTRSEGPARMTRAQPFLRDRALLFRDGWIAVAFQDPYRVDWIMPSGTWRHSTSPLSLGGIGSEGIAAFSGSAMALVAAPDGHVLVRRAIAVNADSVRYDVVDRSSRVSGFFVLAANESVVGYGRSSLYVVRTDSVGLQYLRRAAWPTVTP
jgi:hypothetical protein